VDEGWVELPSTRPSGREPCGLGWSALGSSGLESAEPEPESELRSGEVAVDAIDAVDELLALLARAETPRPAVTLRLRWRENPPAADGEPAVPVVRQVRRNPTAAGTGTLP
jgi:hypothetical protein